MRHYVLAAIVSCAACGRVSFDRLGSASGDDASTDDGGADDGATADTANAGPWSLLGVTKDQATNSLNVTLIGDAFVVVALGEGVAQSVASISDGLGNVFQQIPNASTVDTSQRIELWYARVTTAGAATLTVNGSTIDDYVVWQFSGIRHVAPIDSVKSAGNQAASFLFSPPITTTVSGELILAGVKDEFVAVLDAGDFTDDAQPDGDDFAHLTDPTAPPGVFEATWNQGSSGDGCALAVSFFAGP